MLWLTLLAIAGMGLSSTALYMIPAVVGCSCLSFLAVKLVDTEGRANFKKQFIRSSLLIVPLAYPLAILVLLKVNLIPKPIDIHAFGPEFIPWRDALDNVIGWFREYVRDVVLIVASLC